MGLGACGGGIGEDCGEGLAILLCSKDSSLSEAYFLKILQQNANVRTNSKFFLGY